MKDPRWKNREAMVGIHEKKKEEHHHQYNSGSMAHKASAAGNTTLIRSDGIASRCILLSDRF